MIRKMILKRIASLAAILLILSFLVFGLMVLAPGDPAEKRLTSHGVAVTNEMLQAERERLGLLRPFFTRYGEWLGGVLQGDWGVSFKDDLPVAPKLAAGFRNTVQLSVMSLILALAISIPLSVISVRKKGGMADRLIRVLTFFGNSMPNFLLAVLLMYLLCIRLNIFSVVADGSWIGLFLPALSLAIPVSSRFIRQIRAELLLELNQDYVTGMRARGVKESFILFRNVLRNSLGHILTITGLQIGTLLGGSVVIETIFRWPGLGKLAMDAITARDYPVILGFVLIMGTVYMVINLITDLSCAVLDPRTQEDG